MPPLLLSPRKKNLSLFLFASLLSACTGSLESGKFPQINDVTTQVGSYKIGDPYQVKGVWYYPSEDYCYYETGIASWYGEEFHGKGTANGEIFNMDAVTAAHRTLPMPSLVQVTNLINGKTLGVRVNDRGPFVNGRIIDLSRHAAKLLGFETSGTTHVTVQILAKESLILRKQYLVNEGSVNNNVETSISPTTCSTLSRKPLFEVSSYVSLSQKTARDGEHGKKEELQLLHHHKQLLAQATASVQTVLEQEGKEGKTGKSNFRKLGGYLIQVAVFRKPEFAGRAFQDVKSIWHRVVLVHHSTKDGIKLYRLYVGPLISSLEAERHLIEIRKAGYSDALILKEK